MAACVAPDIVGAEQALGRLSSVSTPALQLTFNSKHQTIVGLTNLLTGSVWLNQPGPVYRSGTNDQIRTRLEFRPLENGEIGITLQASNASPKRAQAEYMFPFLEGIRAGGSNSTDTLAYCFPKKGMVADTKPKKIQARYCSEFPLQFMDVYQGACGGVYIIIRDTSGQPRNYFLEKSNSIALGVGQSKFLEPGETWTLEAALGAHTGDWHDALLAYRRWLRTWYKPEVPRQQWFQEVFNFRQLFLHTNRSVETTGVYDPVRKQYSIAEALRADLEAFGGVDYVHIFDWALDPKRGRVGDYDTWEYLGGAELFRKEIAALQARGIRVGLYLEGYLIDRKSDVFKANGEAWQLLDAKGEPYRAFGRGNLHVCPFAEGWRNHLQHVCLEAVRRSGADGIYIDEFGFGYQYACYANTHNHPVPSPQIQGEADFMRRLRRALPAGTVLYSEETGTDVASQYQDGAFSYSISQCRNEANPARLNLFRFAVPDYKLFEIIRVDAPLGDDPEAVKHVFFNGEGIWLEGPLTPRWFPPRVCQTIAKTHAVLRKYQDAFRGMEPLPLVPTLVEGLYANQFPGGHRVAWTLYNAGDLKIRGEVLKVPHRDGSRYIDAWHERPLQPRIEGPEAYLAADLEPHDVGCLVQDN